MIGLRSWLLGMHNPLVHTPLVVLSWRLLYREWPSLKVFICIVLHDIGYIRETTLEGNDHPIMGARLCGRFFGNKYYYLCLCHSRELCEKYGMRLSALGYADKFWVFLLPNWLFELVLRTGGERSEYHAIGDGRWGIPLSVKRIKEDYHRWWRQWGRERK